MYKYIKRAIDLILSLILICCLSPILVLVAIAIKADSKGPVIFKQKRLGLNEVTPKSWTDY